MRGITIRLPEATLQRLRREAKATGLSIAALVRARLENAPEGDSVHALAGDLAGSPSGGTRSASNDRRRFRR